MGEVTPASALVVTGLGGARVIDADIADLERAWRGAIAPALAPATRPAPQGIAAVAPGKRVLILHANGSNRDHDAALAVELAGGLPEIVHVHQLRTGARRLADYHMLILPGGFSYGDDLGAGVLWALDLRERLGDALYDFVAAGRPVLGICNGFQALMKAGFFEAGVSETGERAITLTYNERRQFECRWVLLEPDPSSVSIFTRGLREPIFCPIAHGEGRLMTRDDKTLRGLATGGRIALRYQGEGYPHNPNGSAGGIAGLSNAPGNVLGLMPHPENHIFPWQHPRWHRGETGLGGLGLFANGLRNA
jgi:phosphoribosylformylglycinamidine synthase I